MKTEITNKTEHAFKSILQLRHYKGKIDIDHRNKKLCLSIRPKNDAKRSQEASSARSLSGGEKSFATVAFILSLWDSIMEGPFYFLDEPDVYLVNF